MSAPDQKQALGHVRGQVCPGKRTSLRTQTVSAWCQELTILEWLERWDRVMSVNKVTLPLQAVW